MNHKVNPIKNIEDDYLWDRTGEPEPEIQQLEEMLGTLGYQPRPLEIPAGLKANLHLRNERKFFRGFLPGLAIAATIAMVLLGLGLWVGLQRLQRGQPSEVATTPTAPAVSPNASPLALPSSNKDQDATAAVSNNHDQKHIAPPRRQRINPSLLARNSNRSRPEARREPVKDSPTAMNEQAEAQAGKDQLMLALRVACAKLNFAQKKTQESTDPRDLIHNQHKIG
jgi:hypothetical protein